MTVRKQLPTLPQPKPNDGLVHAIKREHASRVANYLNMVLRCEAKYRGDRTRDEIETQLLCGECFVGVMVRAMVILARQSDMSKSRLLELIDKYVREI